MPIARSILPWLGLLLWPLWSLAQPDYHCARKAAALAAHADPPPAWRSGGQRELDVLYHHCHWQLDPGQDSIAGRVLTRFRVLDAPLGLLRFDLAATMRVDSVRYHGQALPFGQGTAQRLDIPLPQALPAGAVDSVEVFYQGRPRSTGLGSFERGSHEGQPVLWTLSQPYGAADWWPCRQDLDDKIDSLDIWVDCPLPYRAVANGRLLGVDTLADGRHRFRWQHRHPVAAYLVAVALSNYVRFDVEMPSPYGPVPLQNFVYPEYEDTARARLLPFAEVFELYSMLLGPYPFSPEPYGHVQIQFAGGMEHQTMSFVRDFSPELLAHELVHQWFGDKVTCGSWADIWLNEGFATYFTGLAYEFLGSEADWMAWKQRIVADVLQQPDGAVRVEDTGSVARIFTGRLSYAKGAMLLHMLRWRLGDEAFFTALRHYLDDPALAYGYARTADLQAHLEAASGQNLDGFFADWYEGEGWPAYELAWEYEDSLGLWRGTLWQQPSHPSVDFFEQPVPLRLIGEGWAQDAVLFHDFSGQVFELAMPQRVTAVLFDPDLRLLSGRNVVRDRAKLNGIAPRLLLSPNPTAGPLEVAFATPNLRLLEAGLYDIQGRFLLPPSALSAQGARFDLSGLPKGVYLLRVRTDAGLLGEQVLRW